MANHETAPRSHPAEGKSAVQDFRTILVVEDDPLLLEFVRDYLSETGFLVLPASDTEEALRYFETQEAASIDLVFSDIRIPGEMNGICLAQEIRQLNPQMKILLTSGYSPELLQEYVQDEFPVIQKPYFPEDLNNTLRALLDNP